MSIDYYVSQDKDNMHVVYSQLGVLPKTVMIDPQDGMGYVTYSPERTCKRIKKSNPAENECSACGWWLRDMDSYCPNCGAEIVE